MTSPRRKIAVFPFAVDRELHDVDPSGRLGPLSRCLPRVLAAWLRDRSGQDAHFLPFVGRDGQRSGFVVFDDLMEVGQLGELGGPGLQPEETIDGLIRTRSVHVRIAHARAGFVLAAMDLPWSLEQPLGLLAAVARSVSDHLELPWQPPDSWRGLTDDACYHWFAAEDQVLALDANVSVADPVSGLAHAEAAVVAAPAFAAVWFPLVRLAAACMDRGAAAQGAVRSALERLLPRVPLGDAALLRSMIDLLQRCGRRDAAVALQAALLGLEPGDAGLALALAEDLIRAGSGAEALAVLAPALRLPECDPLVLAQGALLAARNQAAPECDRLMARLDARGTLPAPAARVLALLHSEQRRLTRAQQVLERSLATEPGDRATQLELGRIHLLQGRADTARELLQGLAVLTGGDQAGLAREAARLLQFVDAPGLADDLEQGERALHAGDLRAALRLARRVARRASLVPEAWLLLGKVRTQLGHRRRAVRAFARALAQDPGMAEARSQLGICLVGLGRFHEAYGHLQRAIDALPGQVGPLAHMAQACYYLKKFDEGETWLQRAEARSPGHPVLVEMRRTFFPLR